LGGGRDTSVDGNGEMKKPFDECKMRIIRNAVFQLYPQQNDAMRKAVRMKCVEKINSDDWGTNDSGGNGTATFPSVIK